jgi:hypothetical protein
MKIAKLLIVCGMLTALTAGAASADVVFGNLGPTGGLGLASLPDATSIGQSSRWAVSFTTGSNPLALELTEVVAGLSQTPVSPNQTYTAILQASSGGNPSGAALATATAQVPNSSTVGAKVPFEFPNVALLPNTQYWVSFAPQTASGDVNIWWAPLGGYVAPVAHASSGWTFGGSKFGSGSIWTNAVNGAVSIKAVPEPRTYAMLATGLVVVAGKTLRRRRTAKA